MKLVKCDVCGKIVDPSNAGVFQYDGHDVANIVFKDSSGNYCEHTIFKRDVCLECAVNVLKILYPKRAFLPIQEYINFRERNGE